MKKQLGGSLFLVTATIIWGSAFISQSIGMDHIEPFTFQAIRCFLAVLGLLPVIAIADRFKKDDNTFIGRWANKQLWLAGILCGIPLFMACNLQQFGLVDTDPGKSGFLTAMYIVIVPILEIFLKKKPTIMMPISVILAVLGLYYISFAGVPSVSTSDLLTVCCAFMFAVQILFVDRFAPSVDPLRLNLIQALVCSVLSCVFMLTTETPTWEGIRACAIPLAHTGFLSMGVAYSLQIIGQKHVEPTAAALIMSLEAVFAALFGWLLLKEVMTLSEILGCVMIFIAVVLSQIPVKAPKKC